MKVVFYVSTSLVILVLVLSFIVQNPHNIEIHYYFGPIWDGSLAILLILVLGVGVLFGVLASSLALVKSEVRLKQVTKQLRTMQSKYLLRREHTTKESN